MKMIEQGQIYAGLVTEGQADGVVSTVPAVVRVQSMTPELCRIIRLDSGMMGREGHIRTAKLANDFRLVSQGPEFTSEEVAGWQAETARRQTWVEANIERAQLREEAWKVHKAALETEERRYQAALDHIDTVYRLRTGEKEDQS